MKPSSHSSQTKLWIVVLLLGLIPLCAPAQVSEPARRQDHGPSAHVQQQTPEQSASPEQASPEQKIGPKEAEELFRSVDEILDFASKDTGLPIKQRVQRKLASRDEVERYVERRMRKDRDAKRLERSQVSLKKFGLLPPDFQLRPYLLALLKEQIAGFYDSKTKTVYLLDWVDAEAQKPVLAHELTHALQDQSFNLEKWSEGRKRSNSDEDDIALEEQQAAREAVVEGQAMVVLLDYMLAPLHRTVADSPSLVESLKNSMIEGGDTPMFAKSPLYLRQALTFPYTYGLDFERQILAKEGRDSAFRGAFENPPEDTRQIMQPAAYLAKQVVSPLPIPKLDSILKGAHKRYDFGSIGEFDVVMLVWQWSGKHTGELLAQAWRGGYYFLYEEIKHPGTAYPLICVTRWASHADAVEFAGLYAGSLVKRYTGVREVRPPQEGSGEWATTDQGPVDIAVSGDYVVAIEGLAAPEKDRVRDVIQQTFAQPANDAKETPRAGAR